MKNAADTRPLAQMTVDELIDFAADHVGGAMASSASLCVTDARECLANGDTASARRRAMDSLRYSVGIFGMK